MFLWKAEYLLTLINDRAKRGGSLFEGCSGGGEAPQEQRPLMRLLSYGGFAYVRQFSRIDLPQILRYFNKTWQEVCFGIAGQGGVVGFLIFYQGAVLFSIEGRKFGIFAIFVSFH